MIGVDCGDSVEKVNYDQSGLLGLCGDIVWLFSEGRKWEK